MEVINILHQSWPEPDLYQAVDIIFMGTMSINNTQLHCVNTIPCCLHCTITLEHHAHDSKQVHASFMWVKRTIKFSLPVFQLLTVWVSVPREGYIRIINFSSRLIGLTMRDVKNYDRKVLPDLWNCSHGLTLARSMKLPLKTCYLNFSLWDAFALEPN